MIVLPKRFETKLKEDAKNEAYLKSAMTRFDEIFSENDLYFFKEYTDHGYRHINSVLKAADEIIEENTFNQLTSNDVLLLISAIFLHDIAMHLQFSSFKKLISKKSIIVKGFDNKTWEDLWNDYINEAIKFSSKKKIEIFGNENIDIIIPNLDDKNSLNGFDKKLIGEFIRRNHPRISHEIAITGLETEKNVIHMFDETMDQNIKDLCGLVARSHGLNIRDTYKYLQDRYDKGWKTPYHSNIFFLMVVIRMADYFQIDSSRVLKIPFMTKIFKSPLSFVQHNQHLQTKYTQPLEDDPETLHVYAEPINSNYYLALDSLFKDIQKELDTSWAILGEIYGTRKQTEQFKIKYRRIDSNIFNLEKFSKTVDYVPKAFSFNVNSEIPKLLVAPLYGDDPSYGVRELLQNSLDACFTRMKIDKNYKPNIVLELFAKDKDYFFTIEDNGIGMTQSEISDYFLTIGGSFRKSSDWNEKFVDKNNKSTVRRSGRFGIGILSAYLLGNTIEVNTKSYKDETGYRFSTKLEQEQIELIRDNELSVGTKIAVKITENIYLRLKDSDNYKDDNHYYNNAHQRNSLKFYEWYGFNEPKICYKVDHEEIKNNEIQFIKFTKSEKWNSVETNDFEDIKWKYVGIFERFYNWGDIIYNGIVIPTRYEFGESLIQGPPFISVIDFNAKLPLSLNRNYFTSKLPVEDIITRDILCYILHELLNFKTVFDPSQLFPEKCQFENFNIPCFNIHRHEISSYEKILYSLKGFTLNHSDFYGKFDNYEIMDIIYNITERERDFRYLNKNIHSEYSVSIDELNISLLNKFMRFYHKIEYDQYENLYDSDLILLIENKVLSGIIKTECLVNEETELINNRNYKLEGDLLYIGDKYNELKTAFSKLKCSLILISACKTDSKEEKPSIMSELIEEYLNNDPLIPYNLEERKKKFPKAFKELARFDK